MRVIIIIATSVLLFTSCGVKGDPEYKSQNILSKTINLA